jgi:hypothetical protein
MNLDTISTLSRLDLAHLESMRDHYNALGDHQNAAGVVAAITRMGAEQTQELADSGRLIAHRRVDPDNNRVIHTYTGDISAFMAPFVLGAAVCQMDRNAYTGENSPEAKALRASQVTVTLKPGETVQVVKG